MRNSKSVDKISHLNLRNLRTNISKFAVFCTMLCLLSGCATPALYEATNMGDSREENERYQRMKEMQNEP